MKRLALGTLMVATVLSGETFAFAKATTDGVNTAPTTTRTERRLADSVVVTPQGSAPQQPATAVQPVAAAPMVQTPAPVVAEPRTRKVVNADVQPNHNYMSTIAVSALMGGVAGGLIGGAIYYLGDRNDAMNIAYWAAGGVLVGTGVGLINIFTDESRADRAAGAQLPRDPVPTYRLSLLQTRF